MGDTYEGDALETLNAKLDSVLEAMPNDLKELLDMLDIGAAKLLLARVQLGIASAAEIAQCNAMLKRHGWAVQAGKDEALSKLQAKLDERKKRRGPTAGLVPAPLEDDELQDAAGRLMN